MKNNKHALVWLWRVSGGDKAKILAMTLAQMLYGGSGVLAAWGMSWLIDSVIAQQTGAFWRYAVLLICLILGQLTLRALLRHLGESCRSSLENRFKGRLFRVLLNADYGHVIAVHSGEWLNRLTSDVGVVAEGLADIIPEISGMLIKLIGALCLLVVLIPGLGSLMLPAGAIFVLLTWMFRKKLKSLHKAVQESDGDLRTYLTEHLGAMLVLRAFGRQDQTWQDADEKMKAHRAAKMRKNAFSNLCNIGFGLAIRGSYVLSAVFCGYEILHGRMSYGTFTAVLQLISQIQNPFANLSGFLPKFYAMLASAERLMEAECFPKDCAEEKLTIPQVQALYEQLQSIELRGVSFAYPGEPNYALQNLNLTIPKGQYVAFTGHSGCGKSTALKLLLALYPMAKGTCAFASGDGEISITPRHRALFAYVPQGNYLMKGTIRQALTFDDASVDESRIWHVLEIACAADFVSKLENGLDTMLGERGAGLSEGQIQRLSIARAVLTDRPILLLDEATSALDEATEAAVLHNLKAMLQKTVIIITHRPAAREICDQEVSFG